MNAVVGRMTVQQIKDFVRLEFSDGKPFRLSSVQRRQTYRHHTSICGVGYNDGGRALDELVRDSYLDLVATDHLGFKTFVANAQHHAEAGRPIA